MSMIELIGHKSIVPVNHIGLYSDNTPMIKVEFDPLDVHTIVVRHSSIMQFVAAMFLVDSIRYRGGHVHTLVLPYLPGARQDRTNPTGDVLFAAKSVAEMINSKGFSKVIVLDPHSPVSSGLIHNCVQYPLADIAKYVKDGTRGWDGIIAPDKGAKDRAEIFANALGIPIYYASKTRDVSTGRLSGFEIDVPTCGYYLVVDDICDGGGTFMGLGEKIWEQVSFADLYVTHGIFAKGTSELKAFYKNIYTTDSLQQSDKNIRVIPVLERMKNYEQPNV